MKVRSRYSVKSLSEAEAGELIGIQNETSYDYAFVVHRNVEMDYVALAVVAPGDGQAPYRTNVGDHLDCVSYGKNWLVEVLDALPDTAETTSETPGSVTVSSDGVFLRFGRDPHQPAVEAIYLELEEFKLRAPRSRSVVGSGWRLWIDESDPESELRSPLVEFPPTTP